MWTWFKRHPDDVKLQAYREDQLPPATARRLKSHVERCGRCRELLAEYDQLNLALSRMPATPMPLDLSDQILLSVLAQQKSLAPASSGDRNRLWELTGGLVALALAALLCLWPLLASTDTLMLQMGQVLKSAIVATHLFVTVLGSLYRASEPLRYPALAVAAMSMTLVALLASRRLSSQFSR